MNRTVFDHVTDKTLSVVQVKLVFFFYRPDYFDSTSKQQDATLPDDGDLERIDTNEPDQDTQNLSVESDYESDSNSFDIEPNTNRPVEIEPSSEEETSDDE